MNETLKQRVVGAAVITALAAIFLPMLFDDPVSETENYALELKLPEEPDNDMQTLLDDIPQSREEVLSQPKPAQIETQVKDIQQAAKDADLKGWIIQVGSFSQEQNALEFRDKLRKSHFTAFVDSVNSPKNGTLYRLKVGPEIDEKRAKIIQQQLESHFKVKTLLVSE